MAISVVLVVVLAPMVGVTTVGGTSGWTIPNDETVDVTSEVSVWEQAILPLRTNPATAATQIDNAAWYVSHPDFGDSDTLLNKSTIGVYNDSEPITVHFTGDDTTHPSKLANEEVHLVVARVGSDSDTSALGVDSVSDALRLLDAEADGTQAQLNRNVSFVYEAEATLNSRGSTSFSFTPSESGEYVFFLAQGGMDSSGLAVTDHNLSITGDATIIGVEQAVVHDQPSTVELTDSTPARGDNLTFMVEDQLSGSDVQHAILVYDEQTGFTDQIFKLQVTDDPSTVAELVNNTTVKHSINRVNGVARVEDGTTLLGAGRTGRWEGTSPGIRSLMEFVADRTNREIPQNETIDAPGNGRLDASLTVVSGNQQTINVKTLTNFTASEYRWVHLAVTEQGEIRTNTDTFELGKSWFGVSNAAVTPANITASEAITATATVTNLGNAKTTRPVTLKAKRTDQATWTTLNQTNITLAGGDSTTVSLTGTLPTAGTYDIKLNGRVAGTVTVTASSTPGDGDETGESTDGGGGGGGGGVAIEPPDPIVKFTQQADGSVVADVRNGRAGLTIPISLPHQQATCAAGVTFDGVDVELQRDNPHFTLAINSHATRPAAVASLPETVGVSCYLQVEKNLITNTDIKQATVRFRLSPDQLQPASSPDNVVLYRYHNGSWQPLQTTVTGMRNGQYVFTAATPGFSVFAIGEKQPDLSVTNTELAASAVTVGDRVEVTANITNDGTGQGTYTATLTVAGTTVQQTHVTVPAGATKTVSFNYTATDPGNHTIAVNGVAAGTLSVTETSTPTTTTTPLTTTTTAPSTTQPTTDALTQQPERPSDEGISGSLIALLLLLLFGGAGGLLYYFREEVSAALAPYLHTIGPYLDPYLSKIEAVLNQYRNR